MTGGSTDTEILLRRIKTWTAGCPAARALQLACQRYRIEAYYFGGVCRSCWDEKPPRDIDVVVHDLHWEKFLALVPADRTRNRFGGIKFKLHGTTVDAWAVGSTWTFASALSLPACASRLPETALFNAQAAVALIWHPAGPWVFETTFFEAVRSRILRVENLWVPDVDVAAALALKFAANGWNLDPGVRCLVEDPRVDPNRLALIYKDHT